jgi:hypothetical protein
MNKRFFFFDVVIRGLTLVMAIAFVALILGFAFDVMTPDAAPAARTIQSTA